MKVILKLTTDRGEEISSLVLPIEQTAYLLLSADELAQQYITPYLDNLQTAGAGVTAQNPWGPD